MIDPYKILDQARQGLAPSGSLVFLGTRSVIGGFLTGVLRDPDPLLVLFQEGVVHYSSSKDPLIVIEFAQLSDVRLGARASDDSLRIWLDLYYINGQKSRWRAPWGFGERTLITQRFIEYYTLHKVYYKKP